MARGRIQIKKDDKNVCLVVAGVETWITPGLAKQVGELLFKTGCDVASIVNNAPKD